uniref:Uncharacterized protein n=1 Tax=Sinocyclocheilus rhinocerous TaxID=307959 RepID=A0A673L0D8_9TELE
MEKLGIILFVALLALFCREWYRTFLLHDSEGRNHGCARRYRCVDIM